VLETNASFETHVRTLGRLVEEITNDTLVHTWQLDGACRGERACL